MRHRKTGRKLGRTSSHRKAMYSNMVAALVTHGRIETTEAKAKELRGVAERTINWGVSVSPLYQQGLDKLEMADRVRIVHAKRMARRVLKDMDALDKLFAEVAPKYVGRPGGYTRVLKTRNRRGDAAPMAFIELVPSSVVVPEPPAKKAPAKKKAAAKKADAADAAGAE